VIRDDRVKFATVPDNEHVAEDALTQFLEGDLPAEARIGVVCHLAGCAQCRELATRLSEDLHNPAARRRRWRFGSAAPAREPASTDRWVLTLGAAAALMAVLSIGAPQRPIRRSAEDPFRPAAGSSLPVASLTPGAVYPVGIAVLCSDRHQTKLFVQPVTRQAVLRAYRMEQAPSATYELDYLIPPELGGAPERENLWPEPYGAPVWNARVKDQLERLLPQLVCDHQLELAAAQHEIAADWIAAYKKYFHTDHPLVATTVDGDRTTPRVPLAIDLSRRSNSGR